MLVQAAEASLRTDPDVARPPPAAGHPDGQGEPGRGPGAGRRAVPGPARRRDAWTTRCAGSAGRLRSRAGIAADLEITGTARPLATSAEVVLLRVCQEALANVRKHAGASRASVRLAYRADAVELEVTDDGAGFDPGAVRSGYGLSGMRARVAPGAAAAADRAQRAGAGTTVARPGAGMTGDRARPAGMARRSASCSPTITRWSGPG